MKDYCDIYYLANKFDFNGKVLTEALKKTFENREHAFTIEQFEQVMSFADGSAMQKVFLTKPFTVAVEGKEFTEKWSAADGEWM